MTECLIAFGANQGDRWATWTRTIEELQRAGFANCRSSRVIETRPIGGPGDQANYLNSVIRCAAQFDCREAVGRLLEIEQRSGRRRDLRWGPRQIDLDLLLFGEEVICEPGVEVPHPRMTLRRFVLEPACEVAGQMRHPLSGATLTEIVATIRSARRFTVAWLADDRNEPEKFVQELEEHGPACQIVALEYLDAAMELAPDGLAWRIVIFDQPLQLEELDWIPELVVCDRGASTNSAATIAAAQRFAGATLVLSANRFDARSEFCAALESVPEFRV